MPDGWTKGGSFLTKAHSQGQSVMNKLEQKLPNPKQATSQFPEKLFWRNALTLSRNFWQHKLQSKQTLRYENKWITWPISREGRPVNGTESWLSSKTPQSEYVENSTTRRKKLQPLKSTNVTRHHITPARRDPLAMGLYGIAILPPNKIAPHYKAYQKWYVDEGNVSEDFGTLRRLYNNLKFHGPVLHTT